MMTTRKADTTKSTPTSAKRTPPARKSAVSAATPISATRTRASTGKDSQAKNTDATTTPDPSPQSKAVLAGEKAKESTDAVQVTPPTKADSGGKTTRRVVKRTVIKKKTVTSAKAVVGQTPNLEELGKAGVEESSKKEEADDAKKEEPVLANVKGSSKNTEPTVKNVEAFLKKNKNVKNAEEPAKKEEDVGEMDQHSVETVGGEKPEDPVFTNEIKSSQNQEISVEEKVEPRNEQIEMEEHVNEEIKAEKHPLEADACDEKMERGEHGAYEKFGREHLMEDNLPEHGEEDEALEEEHAELNAVAQERRIKKELEIFVGGLDRDAVEDDVKKVFEYVGEVVEVRLHRDPLTNKNKGYAFVKFATKDQASRALFEMKNPVIHGKRCGTAPSEDNDTLFLGNICNTWTKEAVKQKLKDYGIEGVENVTLVSDAQHEGLSRGFAFLEFSCHTDAMAAYKRLQKPDVIFGHPERTAKVAFAEPLREPDPEVMAQVKSVFVDGLPPYWDEDRVREKFKIYGEIERITLARNMSTSKRKDFGFVDFTTHESAVACIDGINNTELGDGNSKIKVRARLSNPLPKTQAVKGGMSGGFRIGRVNGRGFGRGGHSFSRANFQRGRDFYQHGHGARGGRWGYFRGASSGGPVPPGLGSERQRYGAPGRGRGSHIPFARQRFFPEERYGRPFYERNFDEPYFYGDTPHGIKRPFFMTDQEADYMEPSRLRPRLDYSDPAVSIRGTHYRDTVGSGSDLHSRDYYGSDRGGGTYPSFYGGDRPYGGGYYY